MYYILKARGFSNSDIIEYISDIENKLKNAGIGIDHSDNINLQNYKPQSKEIYNNLNKKNYTSGLGFNHDAAVIEKIQKLRGRPVRKLNDCVCIFVSSDLGLAQINLIDMGHQSRNTIPEVIKDSTFTNILWFKYPTIKLPLSTILSFHSKGLFINRKIWDKFYEILTKLKASGTIDEKDISILIYDSAIQSDLRKMKDYEAPELSKDVIFDRLSEIKEQTTQKEAENIELLKEEHLKDNKRELEEFISGITDNKEILAKKRSKLLVQIIRFFVSIAILALIYYVIQGSGEYISVLSNFAIFITIGLGILAIIGINFVHIWEKLENYIFQQMFNKSLEEIPEKYRGN